MTPVKMIDLDKEISDLEHEEIEAGPSDVPPTVYGKLLCLYLTKDKLFEAKFLWKRIPAQTREGNPELEHLWTVGKALIQKNPPEVYAALARPAGWPQYLESYVKNLKVKTQENYLNLVGRAYSTISLSDFAVYVGMPAADEAGVLELVRSQPGGSWLYDPASKMVTPQRRPGPEVKVAPSEEKLRQLVDFVAFMEK